MICSEKPPPIEPSHQPTLLVGKPTAGPPTYPQSASLLSCQSSQHTKSVLTFRSLGLSVCERQRWGIPVRHAEHFTDRLRPWQWKGVTHRKVLRAWNKQVRFIQKFCGFHSIPSWTLGLCSSLTARLLGPCKTGRNEELWFEQIKCRPCLSKNVE